MHSWSAWNASWVWSLVLIAVTITIHAVGIVLIVSIGGSLSRRRSVSAAGKFVLFVAVALSLAILHGIEAMIWAFVYIQLGALTSPADAALYSVDSMTTRGASGLVLAREWRMMGAAEAGDGMLLFGISTAFLFFAMQRLWESETKTPVSP